MVKLKIQNLLRIIKLNKFELLNIRNLNYLTYKISKQYDTGNSLLIYFCLHKSKIKVNELNIVLMALYKTVNPKKINFFTHTRF